MENEIWRDIPGYEGMYKISTHCRVMGLSRINNVGKKMKARILTAMITGTGYYRVNLCKDGIDAKWTVHRLMAETFILKPEGKTEVNHIDGNKLNNSIPNLEWVTRAENLSHAYRIGLRPSRDKVLTKRSRRFIVVSKTEVRTFIFPCISKAQEIIGVSGQHIGRCLNGFNNSKKYHFEYL